MNFIVFNVPTSESRLKESDDSGSEEDGRDDVAAGGVVVLDAEGGAQQEGKGHRRAHHRQIVLSHQNIIQFCLNIHFNSYLIDKHSF